METAVDCCGYIETVRFRMGEAFMVLSSDDAETLIEEKQEGYRGEIKALEAKIAESKKSLKKLKEELTDTLGDNVALEM